MYIDCVRALITSFKSFKTDSKKEMVTKSLYFCPSKQIFEIYWMFET